MLTAINIQNFVTIDALSLDFGYGLSTITGETGAGKSIIIDALGLVLGDRADAGVVRAGQTQADIQAMFDLSKVDGARRWLVEHGLGEEDESECLLRRTVHQTGRSKCYINGCAVTAAQARALGEMLVDIHGQHEHHRLMQPKCQREYVDDYLDDADLVRAVYERFVVWSDVRAKLVSLQNNLADKTQRVEYLQFQVDEFDALGLVDGEVAELEAEIKRLSAAEQIQQDGFAGLELLRDADGQNVALYLRQVCRLLEKQSEAEPRLKDVVELLTQATVQVDEAADELQHVLDGAEYDPQRLAAIDERLSTIYNLARKHQVEPEGLLTIYQQMAEELASLSQSDVYLADLEEEVVCCQDAYYDVARALSAKRREIAPVLAEKVTQQIQALNLSGAEFSIELIEQDDVHHDGYGLEQVRFLIRVNKGQPLAPLNKVASGGELSRLSLAIEVVASHSRPMPTMVFDEVDVGIGGATAEVVGRLLRKLGCSVQVLCITHLAQVAAQGHQHLQVIKAHEEEETHTLIKSLDKYERICELARMLAGVDVTEQSMAHAQAMLAAVD